MTRTKAELLMKIQELESIIWDGTRQLAAMEAALKQASACCARPAGVCFDPHIIPPENASSPLQYDGSTDDA